MDVLSPADLPLGADVVVARSGAPSPLAADLAGVPAYWQAGVLVTGREGWEKGRSATRNRPDLETCALERMRSNKLGSSEVSTIGVNCRISRFQCTPVQKLEVGDWKLEIRMGVNK